MDMYNLVSFAGIFVLMALAWALSTNRRRLNVRCIAFGVGIQLALGLIIFCAPGSREVFRRLNDVVAELFQAASRGTWFLFGRLSLAPGQTGPDGETSLGFFLTFNALPVIIFFSALMALLYYWRVMPLIIRGFAWVFTRLMRVSGAESLCAASNIFVGIESATTVRPYLRQMTRSELCTILTAGMATIASSVLFVYASFLNQIFPTIAGHLISASILSAPAAIVMSKLLLPEEGEPLTMGRTVAAQHEREPGAIAAIVSGAMAGVKLVVGIVALLMAFLGLLALVNLILGGLGSAVGVRLFGLDPQLSLEKLLGYAMWPLAVVIGVPPADATVAGKLLGERLIVTELPAYQHLAAAIREAGFIHLRSPVVIAYALCGFAHVASLAIFVGGIAALVPERRKDLAALGPRALLAATLACLMTGAVAGTFYHKAETVLQAAATAAP